jgi:hypothetical protein
LDSYEHDPVGHFLVDRLRLNPIGFFLVGLALVAVLQGTVALVYHLNPALEANVLTNFLGSWHAIVRWYVIFPLGIAFVPWLVRQTGQVPQGLYVDGVLRRDEGELSHLGTSLKSMASHWLWPVVAILIVAGSLIYFNITGTITQSDDTVKWGVEDKWLYYRAVEGPLMGIGGYFLLIGTARVILTIWGLYSLLNPRQEGGQRILPANVYPWHPDKCSGFVRIKRYAEHLSLFLALLGSWFFLVMLSILEQRSLSTSFGVYPGLWIAMVGYGILAPLLFFLTLGSARGALLEAKNKHLHTISTELAKGYGDIYRIDAMSNDDLAATSERVRLLDDLHKLTSRFPTWPFNTASLRNFFVTWFVPLASMASINIWLVN